MIVETEELETIHKNIKNRIFIIHIVISLIHQNSSSSESNHAKVIELPKSNEISENNRDIRDKVKLTWFSDVETIQNFQSSDLGTS